MIRFRRLRCSFCRKNESEVLKLVAGPRVYICDKCVAIASRLMNDSHDDNQPPGVQPSAWRKLWWKWLAPVSPLKRSVEIH